MSTKACCMCKEDLPVSKFRKSTKRKDGLQSQCAECQKAYRRKHYEENRQKYIDKAAYWRNKLRRWYQEYKSQFVCSRCGEDHIACIEFHHTDNNKEGTVSQMIQTGSKERLLREIKKCVPLCSNCHRKLHWEERQCE